MNNQRKGRSGRGERRTRERSEFDQKLLDVRRTARVMAGGRRFSFRALVAVGDRKGTVGVGLGKGADVSSAIEKAAVQAKKRLVKIPLTGKKSIPHVVEAKFSAARIRLKPASDGHGLLVGGPIRAIAELGGIKNMTAKILSRTPNKLNNARAAMEALKKLRNQNANIKNQN